MEDILHEAGAAGTISGGGEPEAVATDLDEKNVVEKRKHGVAQKSPEERAGKAAPGNPPGGGGQAGRTRSGGGG